MQEQDWKTESQRKEADKQDRWSEHCKKYIIKDAHGTIKELVFPKALDLDRPKRERTIFTSRQLNRLDEEFRQNQYLVGKDRAVLAKRLGLSETQVKVWFQNRRTKHKKDNERCGASKDVQAESKAAQNVLKLLEYKTALSYNTFLNQTGTNIDAYTVPEANNSSSGKYQDFNECNEHLRKNMQEDLLHGRSLVDNTAGKSKILGTEIFPDRATVAVIPQSSLDDSDLPWSKDTEDGSNRNKSQQHSPASVSASFIIKSSLSIADRLTGEQFTQSPVQTLKPVWNSYDLENSHLEKTQHVSSARSQLESSLGLEKILANSDLMQNCMPHTTEIMAKKHPAIIGRISGENSKLENEVTITRTEGQNADITNFGKQLPSHGLIHPKPNVPHYWPYKSQALYSDDIPCSFSSVSPERSLSDSCEQSALDNMSAQYKLPNVCNPGGIQNEVVARGYGSHVTQILPSLLCYQNHVPNSCSTCQQTTSISAHVSHQRDHVPYVNFSHINHYSPNLYSPTINEQALHYMPVCQAYGNGRSQTSNSPYSLTALTSRFVNHPSLAAQYYGYPKTSPWHQIVPE